MRVLQRKKLGSDSNFLPQETVLLRGSFDDNLLMPNPHATFKQVAKSFRMAEIPDAIEASPQGER